MFLGFSCFMRKRNLNRDRAGTGTHKKVGNNWVWEALAHDNFSVDNKSSYMEVTITLNGQVIPVLGTIEISSDTWGNSFSWSWQQGIYSVNVLHNIITVDLHGTRKWNLFLQGIGTIWSQEIIYRMTIDKTTGQPTSFSKVN